MFYFRGTRKPDFTRVEKIDYDDYWRTRGFTMRGKLMEREEIFFRWISAGAKVLDAGCGNSRLLWELQQKKHCQCTGIDRSPVVLEGQKQAGIKVYSADIEEPEFDLKDSYDYIILSEVLEHLRQPEDLIKKLTPYTKNFALSVPNSAFYRYRIGLMFGGRFFTQWGSHPSEHLRYWSHIDFLEWLKAQGLNVAAWEASNGFWLKNSWPNMFGHQICYLAKTGKL